MSRGAGMLRAARLGTSEAITLNRIEVLHFHSNACVLGRRYDFGVRPSPGNIRRPERDSPVRHRATGVGGHREVHDTYAREAAGASAGGTHGRSEWAIH